MEEVTEKKQPKNQKGAEGENNHSGTSIPKTVTVEEVTEEKQPKNQEGAEGENNHSGISQTKGEPAPQGTFDSFQALKLIAPFLWLWELYAQSRFVDDRDSTKNYAMIYEKRERVVFWLDLVLRAFLVWVVLTILLKTLHLDLPDLSGVVPHIRIPGENPWFEWPSR
ncbi:MULTISPECIES: hypothetical protein [Rothia]|nr:MULTISPECIES: hypothetical protein [Rothia]DAF39202.1 MAG TPA: hypothetical protein [Caudoviricetes sp.]OFQ63956.1 hypothetical protein HMPREF2927_07105 [Rothia sp. HMSC061E04]DAN29112.1 MAG TPA: hypothetical protein [Caudoviricetes sp.]DAN46193.1 MAG TPA: hypothetical protein [Caudoviricetes sp.]DAY14019.1 MAG TPA: hypothetical protein [Caudoviricetes sp.]